MSSTSTGTFGRSELQDLTECPICCLRYDRPLQLTCGHSFCGNCVDRLIADARNAGPRNDNFLEGIRRIPLPNLDRGEDPLNFIQNRIVEDIWVQPPRPPPPLHYGLGGIPPRHGGFRNYLYDEPPPFPFRGIGANTELVIKCPECRQLTKVPPEGLSVNYRLQELVARVSETAAQNNNMDNNENDESHLPKCLVCDEVISKGVYLSCRTCAAEAEAMRQLCSMCCLRNHNGHDIEEKRFLTMGDIEVGKESVSEAAGRGYQAVDQATHDLDACAASAKDFFQESCHNVLRTFELIASNMQFEVLSCHDELEQKVSIAQEISAKLEQLPDIVKGVLDEFRKNLDAAMNLFVSSTLIYDGLRAGTLSLESMNRNQELDGNSCDTSPDQILANASMDSEIRSGCRSNSRDVVRDFPRSFPPLDRRKTRQLRMMQQQCSALRRQRLQERLNRDSYGAQLYNLGATRQRHERLRDELRNDLFDTDDRSSRDHAESCRRHRGAHPNNGLPITENSPGACSSRMQAQDERGRSNSVEIIPSTPPAVADLEQRAGRLIITPERRLLKSEAGAEEDGGENGIGCSKINSKRRRGVDPIPAGTNLSVDPNSAAYVEATVEQEPCLRRTAKRKIRTSSIPQFAHHSNDMSGPSFLAHVAEDASVGDGVDSSHGEASSDINFEDLNFLE